MKMRVFPRPRIFFIPYVMQTLTFGDGIVPSISSFDIARTKTCKLFSVQDQPNKKLKRRRRKWMPNLVLFASAIKEFSTSVKEIEKLNKVIERIKI
jgi:hypothetical protein